MLTAIASIFVLGMMVFFHELGHFTVAKWTGVRVLEFSMGMGPKLWGRQKGETYYALRLLPIGGYVRMAGESIENEEEQEALVNDPGSFQNKTVLQRMAIIFAGPLMNFILALVLFVCVFAYIGIPVESNVNELGTVLKGKPAYAAGLQPGDKITAINDRITSKWSELTNIIHQSAGKELTLRIERQGKTKEVKVVPQLDPQTKQGMIGIANVTTFDKKGVLQSAAFGVQRTFQFTQFILVSLYQMITGKIPADVGGPVAIVSAIGQGASQGFTDLLGLTGMLSIQLGLLNLFPIPALDGSRLVFLAVEGLRGKPIDPAKENFIHLIGFALLLLFIVVVTYNDIIRLITGKGAIGG